MNTKEKSHSAPQATPKKYPFWFYIAGALLPFIFLLLIEAGLRIFNYGDNYKVFDKVYSSYDDLLFLNSDVARKYFVNLKNPPTAIADGFAEQKKENTYRIFVLGESSAAGWPYIPNASFPRHLRRMLELKFPDKNFEVINLGMSAVSTYTLRDFTEALIEHSPDLVLVYTGHNEYYGALGVASTQSVAGFPFLNNLYLNLIEFRTVQVFRDAIRLVWGSVASVGSDEKPVQNETLMEQMVGENLVPYNSTLYSAGLKQFESNMRDILDLLRENKVPVILSTLTSNLSGNKPFESVKYEASPEADKIFTQAIDKLRAGDSTAAKKLFEYAKDLDALRFRAPSAINDIIRKLSAEYNLPLADVEAVFSSESPGGITGNNLMVDHLHPNVTGYKLIADTFFDLITENNLKDASSSITKTDLRKISWEKFPFTKLDSVIADLRIKILTGGYPFVPRGEKNKLVESFSPADKVDSLAMFVVDRIMTLDEAHFKLAEFYWQQQKYASAAKEVSVLIEERPFNTSNYEQLINMLIDVKQYDLALPYLQRYDKINSNAYTNKWLGSIYLDRGNHSEALKYLQKSYNLTQNDPQLLYNLAGAYYLNNRPKEAFEAIRQCLSINPQNRAAQSFYSQLKPLVESLK